MPSTNGKKTPYVCSRCGLSVRHDGNYWRHVGGRFTLPSCKQTPNPVLREEYERSKK